MPVFKLTSLGQKRKYVRLDHLSHLCILIQHRITLNQPRQMPGHPENCDGCVAFGCVDQPHPAKSPCKICCKFRVSRCFLLAILWMDEIHFAPPKKPWFLMIPLHSPTNVFFSGFKVARFPEFASIHSMWGVHARSRCC